MFEFEENDFKRIVLVCNPSGMITRAYAQRADGSYYKTVLAIAEENLRFSKTMDGKSYQFFQQTPEAVQADLTCDHMHNALNRIVECADANGCEMTTYTMPGSEFIGHGWDQVVEKNAAAPAEAVKESVDAAAIKARIGGSYKANEKARELPELPFNAVSGYRLVGKVIPGAYTSMLQVD